MTNFLIKIYLKWKNFETWLLNLFYLLEFTKELYKLDVFRKGDPSSVLEVLREYVYYSWRNYKSLIVLNRTPEQSASLLSVLISSWFETGSSVTLSQILEVLKNEFIEREINGRK